MAGAATPPSSSVYDRAFWLTCLSNAVVMLGIVLLYRYADLISYLGGTEFHLGWIVGVGMVGAIVVRPVLGRFADRLGAHRIWWASLAVLAVCCFAHLGLDSCHGPTIYLVRIFYSAAVAGVFGAAMTWVCSRVPPARAAEMIGMLGAGGFVAMILGSLLADLLLGTRDVQWPQLQQTFVVAGTLSLVSLGLAWMAARGSGRPTPRRQPPLLGLLGRYAPRMVLLVGAAIGMSLSLPNTFLRPFAEELGTSGIGLFFSVYALTALVTRIATRRFTERFGTTPTILLGLGLSVAAMLLFAAVRSPWQLLVPAVAMGMAHAIVFPPLIAVGSQAFPLRHRGTGTMLVWASYDVGVLIGAPLAGVVVRTSSRLGLPAYPTMFLTVALVAGTLGLVYARWALAGATHPINRGAIKRRRRLRRPIVMPAPHSAIEEKVEKVSGTVS